jgi:hypothetical protein
VGPKWGAHPQVQGVDGDGARAHEHLPRLQIGHGHALPDLHHLRSPETRHYHSAAGLLRRSRGRHPSRRRRALTALHHIALEHTELQRLRLRLASWSWRRQCRRGARGDRTRWGGGEGECEKGLRAEEDTLTQLWGRSSQRPNVS